MEGRECRIIIWNKGGYLSESEFTEFKNFQNVILII